jgi:hypothetical protein
MADFTAIATLLARYGAGNDKRDLGIIESCFTEDATCTIAIAGGDTYGPLTSRPAILEFFGAALGAQSDRRRHVVTNIAVLDDTHVDAYLTLIVTDEGKTEVKSAGIYELEITAEPRIRSMVLSLDNGF